jgi:hypothetical protein
MLPAIGRSQSLDDVTVGLDFLPSALWETPGVPRTSKHRRSKAAAAKAHGAAAAAAAAGAGHTPLDAKVGALVAWVQDSLAPLEGGGGEAVSRPGSSSLDGSAATKRQQADVYARGMAELQQLAAQSGLAALADALEFLFVGYRQAARAEGVGGYVDEISRVAASAASQEAATAQESKALQVQLAQAVAQHRKDADTIAELTEALSMERIAKQAAHDERDASSLGVQALEQQVAQGEGRFTALEAQFASLQAELRGARAQILGLQQQELVHTERLRMLTTGSVDDDDDDDDDDGGGGGVLGRLEKAHQEKASALAECERLRGELASAASAHEQEVLRLRMAAAALAQTGSNITGERRLGSGVCPTLHPHLTGSV